MPTDFTLKSMNAIHKALLKVSGGRLGDNLLKMPVLELTTKGRKSGEPRSVMLTVPIYDGDDPVIVASRGGDDINPAWFLNLRDDPNVEVAIKGKKTPMRADVATTEERARLWPELSTKHANYAGYQKKTDREIPIVILRPRN